MDLRDASASKNTNIYLQKTHVSDPGTWGIWATICTHQQHCQENLFWDGDGYGWGGESFTKQIHNFHHPDINIFNLSCKWWFAVLTSLHNLCNNQLQPFHDDKGVNGNGYGPGCITGIWCRVSWAADPLQWEGSMNVGYPPKRRSSWHPRDFPLNKSEGNFKGVRD